jgi:hypothetical protein
MLCRPPEQTAGRFRDVDGDLARLPYCGDHDASDLRARLEADA